MVLLENQQLSKIDWIHSRKGPIKLSYLSLCYVMQLLLFSPVCME